MNSETVLLTPGGMEALKQELENLVEGELPSLLVRLAEARAHGDLSENAEYHAAKERKRSLETRIGELNDILVRAEVFEAQEEHADGKCLFGSMVHLSFENTEGKDDKRTFHLVSSFEAEGDSGKLSISSPLGRELLGKSAGDFVEVQAPAGTIVYEIVSISYRG